MNFTSNMLMIESTTLKLGLRDCK